MVQWLRLCGSNAGSEGLIPGWGIKIPHATCMAKKTRKKGGKKGGVRMRKVSQIKKQPLTSPLVFSDFLGIS